MQPRDRSRLLRSLGLGLGSLLLLCGAVLASQGGKRADDHLTTVLTASHEGSATGAPSRSPAVEALRGGEVGEPSDAPEASSGEEAADDHAGAPAGSGTDVDQHDEDGSGPDDHSASGGGGEDE
jgi:hypothetical protein